MILKISIGLIGMTLMSGFAAMGAEQDVELNANKDTFGRSNKRNANSGASEFMLLAPGPSIKSLVGFDLSSVTNEIISAELSFRVLEDNRIPLSLTVAQMVSHEDNEEWVEGVGNLGVLGQNARVGESTFQWRAFRDQPWKAEDGKELVNLMDSKLWKSPPMKLNKVEWTAGDWVTLPIVDVSMLEELRNSEGKVVTYGIWGTSGNGIYKLNSKESGEPARLVLKTKEAKKGE